MMSELFDAKERIKELEGEYIARLHETEKSATAPVRHWQPPSCGATS